MNYQIFYLAKNIQMPIPMRFQNSLMYGNTIELTIQLGAILAFLLLLLYNRIAYKEFILETSREYQETPTAFFNITVSPPSTPFGISLFSVLYAWSYNFTISNTFLLFILDVWCVYKTLFRSVIYNLIF